MPDSRCLEIDTEFDLALANQILSQRNERGIGRIFPSNLEAIVFDFDGVMTDDTVWTTSSGEEIVRCSREDGQGLARAKDWGIKLLILSTERNPVVTARAKKLHLDVIQNAGLHSKAATFRTWLDESGYSAKNVLYMGNDLNDVECMRIAGFAVAPASARQCAKDVADYVLSRNGGNGAVRECIEFIAEKTGKTL